MGTRIYIAKKAEWHFPEKNNGFSVILLLFTKAKIKTTGVLLLVVLGENRNMWQI